MDAICEGVRRRFAEVDEVRVHRRFSSDLHEILQGTRLDWVYIDGNHSRAFVKQDLDLCWPCLRGGGYITGDDYSWRDLDGSYGVREAVRRVCRLAPAARRADRRTIPDAQALSRRVRDDYPVR